MLTETTHPVRTLQDEFDRQSATLAARGYPWLAGLTDEQFAALLAPLRERLAELPAGEAAELAECARAVAADGEGGEPEEPPRRLPFTIVVDRALIPVERMVGRLERRGREAVSMLSAEEFTAFLPTDGNAPPAGGVHLLLDVDTGAATRNDPPDRALPILTAAGRLPLTIEEGVALVTHHPEAVATNNGFSLLASRRGDRRVPAMWIGRGRPKLGWCFAGMPHSWLGSASCACRIGL